MNSEMALRAALDKGLDGVEMDVQLTADSVLVAHHDLQLHGPTCMGRIADHDWQALQACAQPGVQGAFQGVRLKALLEELAKDHPQAEYTLDVKLDTDGDWWTYLHRFARAIERLEREADLKGRLIVECRSPDLLQALKEQAPNVARYLITEDAAKGIGTAVETGCAGITMPADVLDEAEATRIHDAGLKLTLYGVGSRWSLQHAVDLKPDRIQVDD